MAERKERMSLLSRYNKLYLQRYEQKSNINLNVEQWSADGLIESYGLGQCYDLLQYYFDISQNPSWNSFAYRAQDLLQNKTATEKDLKEREERRLMGKRWLSE